MENGNSYLPEMLQPENDSESRLNDHDDLHILDFGKSMYNRFCFTFLCMYITYVKKYNQYDCIVIKNKFIIEFWAEKSILRSPEPLNVV